MVKVGGVIIYITTLRAGIGKPRSKWFGHPQPATNSSVFLICNTGG